MTDIQHRPQSHIQASQQEPPLYGERVTLRRPTMNDAPFVFRWERDDEVWKYDPHRPYSKSMPEFLPLFERNYVKGNGRQFWFIIENERHIPIGTITYFNLDQRTGQVEVGLGIGEKSQWGKGYGAEAISVIVGYLFALPGLVRIYAETAMANHSARKAFTKNHFTEVGQIFDPRSSGAPWILLEIWRKNSE